MLDDVRGPHQRFVRGRLRAGARRFQSNFTDGDDVGAAVAVWVEGDLVVNLWGGFADAAGLRPWRRDTLASIYSGSKGLTSTCVHLLADRGELDLHAPVARYWPEFGQAGKQDITVAMVLGHRSGVIGPRTRLHWADAADWDAVCADTSRPPSRGGSPAPRRAITW